MLTMALSEKELPCFDKRGSNEHKKEQGTADNGVVLVVAILAQCEQICDKRSMETSTQ